jgi:hypothetical protein
VRLSSISVRLVAVAAVPFVAVGCGAHKVATLTLNPPSKAAQLREWRSWTSAQRRAYIDAYRVCSKSLRLYEQGRPDKKLNFSYSIGTPRGLACLDAWAKQSPSIDLWRL